MGKSKYDSHVKPHLDKITKWTEDLTDEQIAARLKISRKSFIEYKKQHPELVEALEKGKKRLVVELKDTLKKKAKGFYYEEVKTVKIHNPDSDAEPEWIEKIEINRKYAQPDTGAAHLLLKNLDPTWRNDDAETMKLKKQQVEIQKQKLEQDNW
ncbi:MAG: hypothetical protein J6S67_11765 [Methanobrevibacter sp.]|nr:hypothetical protein [Methanobrevibacter sp.]